MNRTPSILDALAGPQVERIPLEQCRFLKRRDGSSIVTFIDDDGAIVFGPVHDVDKSAGWPFEAGVEQMVLATTTPAPARDPREALNNGLSVEGFGEMMRDPSFRVIAELTLLQSVAIEGVDRLAGDLVVARGMLKDKDFETLDDLLAVLVEQADALHAELRNPKPLP